MNAAPDTVSVPASLIFALLDQYEHLQGAVRPIFELAQRLDRQHPDAAAPIRLYNDICRWLEKQYGPASLREAGRALGPGVHAALLRGGALGLRPTPNALFEALRRHVATQVQDPQRRGWELLESGDQRVRLRLTQSFNCMLQDGLLFSLLEQSGALLPRVNHVRCVRQGAAFCEYEALWLKARVRPPARFAVAKAG